MDTYFENNPLSYHPFYMRQKKVFYQPHRVIIINKDK